MAGREWDKLSAANTGIYSGHNWDNLLDKSIVWPQGKSHRSAEVWAPM